MLISIKNQLKVLYKHSKIFWVGWPFDLIGNLHLKKNNAPFFFIHNNLIPRTLMAACEKVPNLISFFVCAKLRLKILLSGPQCCPRNKKILHKMTVNYKYGPVIHFQRIENVTFWKTSRYSFTQNCSNMSKSLVLWSRFGSFGEKQHEVVLKSTISDLWQFCAIFG